MRNILIIITVILSFLTSLEAKKYALIVGMPSGFKSPTNQGIKIDTNNMKQLLKMYNFKITKLSNPTVSKFRRVMKSFKKLKQNDTFIFYYSGHGAQTKDLNGDEKDGRDEAIVLNPSHSLIIDDELYKLLSKIKANKYVFFDSCHSATAFKFSEENNNYTSKSMGIINDKDYSQYNSFAEKKAKNSLVFMGASRDFEPAIGTGQGSYFTNALIDGIKRKKADLNKNGKITFDELLKFTRNEIKKYPHNKINVQIPQLYYPSSKKTVDILNMLKGYIPPINSQNNVQTNNNHNLISTNSENSVNLSVESKLEKKLDMLLKSKKAKSIDIKSDKAYFEGDNIVFSVDGYGQNGYLYIIYSDLQKHTLLYPNKYFPRDNISNGTFSFPNDIDNKLNFRVKKPFGRAVVFTILSPKPLNIYRKNGSNIFDSFNRSSNKAKYLIKKLYNLNTTMDKIHIGKAVFTTSEGI